jgi:hypothetical protein
MHESQFHKKTKWKRNWATSLHNHPAFPSTRRHSPRLTQLPAPVSSPWEPGILRGTAPLPWRRHPLRCSSPLPSSPSPGRRRRRRMRRRSPGSRSTSASTRRSRRQITPRPWPSSGNRPPRLDSRRARLSSSPGSPCCCCGGPVGGRRSPPYSSTPTLTWCRRSRTSGTTRPFPPPSMSHPVASTREAPR